MIVGSNFSTTKMRPVIHWQEQQRADTRVGMGAAEGKRQLPIESVPVGKWDTNVLTISNFT